MDYTEDRGNVPDQKNLIDLDQILEEEVGQFGRYQIVTLVFIVLILVFFSFASGEYNFTAAQIPHRCRIPECDGSSSDVSLPEFTPSWLLNAINGTNLYDFENCTRFGNTTSRPPGSGTCPSEWFNRTSVGCDEYIYQNTNGAVYDFDLGCDEWRLTMMDFFTAPVTSMILPTVGGLGDSQGRRPVLIISVFIASCFGFARSFITSYVWFVVLRVIQFGLGYSAFGLSYVLGIEMAGPSSRATVGAILSTMIPLGQIILGLLAWAVPWRTLLLIIFTPQLLVLSYFWIISESVRWLLSKELFTQSENILRKIAKMNQTDLSDATINDLQTSTAANDNGVRKESPSILRLLKRPDILRRVGMGLLWFLTYSVLQYTIDEKTVHLTEHPYLNHMYVTAFAIPGIWTAAFLLDRIGRKRVLIAGFLLCAACQLAFAFIPTGQSILLIIVYLLSKYFLAVVTSSVNLYTVELFPTEFRSLLFAYFYMHTVLGIGLGSLIASLGPISWIGLPSILFSCLAMTSAVVIVFAPETRGTKLPDTLDEAAQIGKEEKSHIPLVSLEN